MIQGGAWVGADEFAFLHSAQEYLAALRTLSNNTSTPWVKTHRDTFESGGGIWSGEAGHSAASKGTTLKVAIATQERLLTAAVYWNEFIAQLINSTKTLIAKNVADAQQKIASLTSPDQNDIDKITQPTHNANLSLVSTASDEVKAPYRPPFDTDHLLANGLSTDFPRGDAPSAPSSQGGAAPNPSMLPGQNAPPQQPQQHPRQHPQFPLIHPCSPAKKPQQQPQQHPRQHPQFPLIHPCSPAKTPQQQPQQHPRHPPPPHPPRRRPAAEGLEHHPAVVAAAAA